MGIIGFLTMGDTEELVQPVRRSALDLGRVTTQAHARLGAMPVCVRDLVGRIAPLRRGSGEDAPARNVARAPGGIGNHQDRWSLHE